MHDSEDSTIGAETFGAISPTAAKFFDTQTELIHAALATAGEEGGASTLSAVRTTFSRVSNQPLSGIPPQEICTGPVLHPTFVMAGDPIRAIALAPGNSTPSATDRYWIESTTSRSTGTTDLHMIACESGELAVRALTLDAATDPGPAPADDDAQLADGELLNIGFGRSEPGVYDDNDVAAEWDNEFGQISGYLVRPADSLTIEHENDNSFASKTFPANTYNTSSDVTIDHKLSISWRLDKKIGEGYFAYRIRMPVDFAPVKGGKLPGLCGGTCPVGGQPTTRSISNSGRSKSYATGWSARNMWRSGSNLVQYVYSPDETGEWGKDYRYARDEQLSGIADGLWHNVVHRVVMNDPGQSNGLIEAWVDGTQVLEITDIRFRDDYSYAIDALKFTSYFGGHDTSWATPADTFIDFDDIRISTEPLPQRPTA